MAMIKYDNGNNSETYEDTPQWNNSLGKTIGDGFQIKWDELDDNDINVETVIGSISTVTAKRSVQLQFGLVGDNIIEWLQTNVELNGTTSVDEEDVTGTII